MKSPQSPLYSDHLSVILTRTSQALASSDFNALLLHSGTRKEVFRDDFYYPFRANAPFKVFAPLLDAADSFVYFEPGRKPVLVFQRDDDYWHKPAQLPPADWVSSFEVRTVRSRAAARAALPGDLSRTAFVGEPFRELTDFGVAAVNPDHLLLRLEFPRAVKTAYELAALREASNLGARGHSAAARAFDANGSEFDIALAFLKGTGLREQELPYNPIIAINDGAAVLHYQVQARQPPAQRRSLLIDAGAEFAGYASDITRTYAAAAGDFADLIAAMDRLQLKLCDLTRAGVDWRDIHVASYRDIGALLVEAGILKCSAAEAESSHVTSVFYPHGIGHLLGLQVHDAGGLLADDRGATLPRPDGHPFLRLTRVLQAGFVVTMEPGFYFIDALLAEARGDARAKLIDWNRVEQLKPFGGIRIEDNLAVRPAGPPENLTRDAFRAAAMQATARNAGP
jgi:Xaa-Pro dipeptidase